MVDAPKRRWYRLTPDRATAVLVAVVGLLLASEQFGWFGLGERNVSPSLLAAGIAGAAMLLGLVCLVTSLLFRWRFQFSVRSLLLLTLVVAVLCGWIARQAEEQRVAVDGIQSAGGTVMYDYHEAGPRAWSTAGIPRGPRWMRDLLEPDYFDRVVYVGLFNTPENGDWIDAFNRLKSVNTLLLSGPHVNDETLDRMNYSISLVELHLSGSSITDDGLRNLEKFPRLRWLMLRNTSITDKGMPHLAAIRGIEELDLYGTEVSDASAPSILILNHIQKINLKRTRVTDQGARRLQQSLPRCKIEH